MEVKLYVGNLSYETNDDELRTLFAQAGTVTDVAVIRDRDSGSSKGFGFVTMSSQDEAKKAIEMFNGHSMGNRELTVNVARPREERSNSGGYRGNSSNRGGGGYRSGGGNRRY